ncbi:MAG: DNA/RNA non-specific endonuclease [Candidatus Delongbacteria bacterium]
MLRIAWIVLLVLACRVQPADHLRQGLPSREDVLLEYKGFALGYRERDEQAAWVSYCLTKAELRAAKTKRSEDFRRDLAVPTGSATLEDYKGSGYDRGHLAPAADMAFHAQAMSESFLLSNMSPQHKSFNRGVWSKLEEQVREFARQRGRVWVVTGPVLDQPLEHVGPSQVSVPRAYYKVLYAPKPRPAMLGFLLPNAASSVPLQHFVVSVDSVEALTGLDFFAKLPDAQERRLEASRRPLDWQLPAE